MNVETYILKDLAADLNKKLIEANDTMNQQVYPDETKSPIELFDGFYSAISKKAE